MIPLNFMVLVTAFIRDWHQINAHNATGGLRKYLMGRSMECERLINEVIRPAEEED